MGRVRNSDSGQISILLIGMMSVSLLLILGVIGATSMQLSRIQLLDAADAAALDAADSIAEATVYEDGVGDGLQLTSDDVVAAASENVARRVRPGRVASWNVAAGTGTPDGRTAVVVLQGQAAIPLISQALDVFGSSITITVQSGARSDVN